MPKIVVREGERAADIARRVLGDARSARELIGVTDPFRPLPAGTVLFLPSGVGNLAPPQSIMPMAARHNPHLNGDGGGPSPDPSQAGPAGTGPGATGPGVTPGAAPAPAPAPAPTGAGAPSGYNFPPAAPLSGFGALPGPEQDQITNLVNLFDSLIGYPTGFDANAMQTAIMTQGLASLPEEAFAYMFSQLSADQQTHMPWARFGLDEQTYHQEAGRYQSMWFDMTGVSIPQDLLQQAIVNQWTIQQMMQAGIAAAGGPSPGGTSPPIGPAAGGKTPIGDRPIGDALNAPWLLTGQTYQQVSENYYSAFGSLPTDIDTLRSWFTFRTGVAQSRSGPEVQAGLTSQAQTRMRDVEVR